MGDGIGSSGASPIRPTSPTGSDRPKPSDQLSSDAASRNPQAAGQEQGGLSADSDDSGLTDGDVRSREPAVSIAASAAALKIGDQISATVSNKDAEGRPLIDTSDARYALKPDSGLKAGDAVELHVRDTTRVVTADLLRVNHRTLEEPAKVTLTIITLHTRDNVNPQPGASPVSQPTPQNPVTYARPTTSIVPSVAAPPPAAEAIALAPAGTLTAPSTTALPSAVPSGEEQARVASGATAAPAETIAKIDRSSPNFFTAVSADARAGFITLPVLEPVLTITGQAAQLTQIDQSLADLPSLATAKVQAVAPLPFAELASLQLPAQFFAGTTQEPALITTDKGPFITPAPVSTTLIGAVLVVDRAASQTVTAGTRAPTENTTAPASVPSQPLSAAVEKALQHVPPRPDGAQEGGASAGLPALQSGLPTAVSAPPSVQHTSATYPAQLIQSNASTPQPAVALTAHVIPSNATSAPIGSLPIDAVRITGSRLSANGPVTDVQLTTAIGRVSLTLPSAERPIAGDLLFVARDAAIEPAPQQAPIYAKTAPVDGSALAQAETDQRAALPGSTDATVAAISASPTASASLLVANEAAAAVAANVTQTIAPPAAELISAGRVDAPAPSAPTASFEESIEYLAATPDTSAIAARSADGGAKLTNSVLFLLTALKRGTPEALLGRTGAEQLQQGNEPLLAALTRDLPALQAAANPEAIGDWRQIALPLDTRDGVAHFLNFLFRETPVDRDGGGNGADLSDNQEDTLVEFKMDVRFSILGDIALHGRIHDQRFDMGLESPRPLGASLEKELSALFAQAVDANGFTGALSFMTTPDHS